jgi:hypothetical protein
VSLATKVNDLLMGVDISSIANAALPNDLFESVMAEQKGGSTKAGGGGSGKKRKSKAAVKKTVKTKKDARFEGLLNEIASAADADAAAAATATATAGDGVADPSTAAPEDGRTATTNDTEPASVDTEDKSGGSPLFVPRTTARRTAGAALKDQASSVAASIMKGAQLSAHETHGVYSSTITDLISAFSDNEIRAREMSTVRQDGILAHTAALGEKKSYVNEMLSSTITKSIQLKSGPGGEEFEFDKAKVLQY